MNRSVNQLAAAICASCLAIGFGADRASGDTVTMDYLGLGLGSATGGYTINYYDYDSSTVVTKGIGGAGQMRFNITASTSPLVPVANDVRLFCSDVYDWIYGPPATYDLVPLASAPNSPPNAPPGGDPSGGMGSEHAALVSHLYSNYYSLSDDGHTNASAFQLAVWELVNEDLDYAAANSFSLTNAASSDDIFYVTAGNNSARSLANTWLAAVWTAWDQGALVSDFSLMGTVLEEYQDMIIIVPVPKALWVMILGLPSILLLRRFAMA